MRKVFKYIVGKTYRPLLVKYLAKTRVYRYRNILLEIPPEVFHPRFFFSTKLLLAYLSRMSLNQKTFLERDIRGNGESKRGLVRFGGNDR